MSFWRIYIYHHRNFQDCNGWSLFIITIVFQTFVSINYFLNIFFWPECNSCYHLQSILHNLVWLIFSQQQSVQSLSHVRLFETRWTAAHQASVSVTDSWSLLKLMSSSSQWCHPTISSSVVPFSSCLQSFPASGSFQMSQFFASGGQSIGVSASASALPMNIQDWFPLRWTGWISLQHSWISNTTVQKYQFIGAQLSLQSNSHIHTWPQEKPQSWLDGPLLAK